MMHFFRIFWAEDDGAVTVDWVVLTAAIVGLGILVLGSVRDGAQNLADDIETNLTNTGVGTPAPAPAPGAGAGADD